MRDKDAVIFARLDQRLEAERVGLDLNPTGLLIFGNPKVGTFLMQAVPGIALDLPLARFASESSRVGRRVGQDLGELKLY